MATSRCSTCSQDSSTTLCLFPLSPIQHLLMGLYVPASICTLADRSPRTLASQLFSVGMLGLVALVHGLLWLCLHRHHAAIPSWGQGVFNTEKWKKTPYLRTTCALFMFTCESFALHRLFSSRWIQTTAFLGPWSTSSTAFKVSRATLRFQPSACSLQFRRASPCCPRFRQSAAKTLSTPHCDR